MNREKAHQILNQLQDGKDVSFDQIKSALFATGDLHDGMRIKRVEKTFQEQSNPSWENTSTNLVAGNKSRHIENSWPGWSKYLDYRNEHQSVTI